MADETEEAKKTQLEYLEKQRATYQKGTKEYELLTGIIQKLNKSIKETQTQINELSKRVGDEKDARKLLSKELVEERRRIEESSKSRKQKDEEWQKIQKDNSDSMKGATQEQKKAVDAQFRQAEALVKTEQRQKGFNESLALTKSYLLPLGQAAGDVAKSLAASINKDPLQAGADMASKYAEKAGQGLNAAGTAAGGLGQTLTTSTNPRTKGFGILLQGAGLAAQGLGAAAKLAGQAMSTIAPIMVDYQKSFTQAAAAGAVFGGGMSELRNIAGSAGVKMGDLVAGISAGQDAFERSGISLTGATKMIGQFGKGLSSGKEATELFALGFTDVKDRIALTGSAFEAARSRGIGFAEAQGRITELTVQYGKDLKVNQQLLGKSAEQEMAKARAETMRGALINKLTADQKTVFQSNFTALGKLGPDADKARIALTQIAGNHEVTDPAIRANEAYMDMLREMAADVQAGSKDGAAASAKAIKTLSAAGKAAAAADSIGVRMSDAANQAGQHGSDIAKNIGGANDALIRAGANIDDKAMSENIAGIAKAMDPKTMDPTTEQFAKLNIAAAQTQVALEQVATQAGAVKLFGEAMGLANTATMELVKTINKVTGGGAGGAASSAASGLMDVISSKETWMMAAGTIGAEVAAKLGGVLGKIPTAGGSTLGGAVSGAAGGAGQWLSSKVGSVVSAGKGMLTGAAGLAGSASGAVSAGASGLAGSAGAELAKGFGSSFLKKIPLVGSAIAGGMEYMQSGKLGRSLAAGIGSGLGAAAGGLGAGAVTGGVAAIPGAIVGGMAGEKAGTALYDWMFGEDTPAAVQATPSDQGSGTPTSNLNTQTQQFAAMTEAARAEAIKQAAGIQETDRDKLMATALTSKKEEDKASMQDMTTLLMVISRTMEDQLDLMRNISNNTRNTVSAVS